MLFINAVSSYTHTNAFIGNKGECICINKKKCLLIIINNYRIHMILRLCEVRPHGVDVLIQLKGLEVKRVVCICERVYLNVLLAAAF